MSLQRCDQCTERFPWTIIYKSLMLGYKPIICNECAMKHKVTIPSRIIVSITVVMIPLLILYYFLLQAIFLPNVLAILLMVSLSFVLSLLDPFLVIYSSDYRLLK